MEQAGPLSFVDILALTLTSHRLPSFHSCVKKEPHNAMAPLCSIRSLSGPSLTSVCGSSTEAISWIWGRALSVSLVSGTSMASGGTRKGGGRWQGQ